MSCSEQSSTTALGSRGFKREKKKKKMKKKKCKTRRKWGTEVEELFELFHWVFCLPVEGLLAEHLETVIV